MKSFSHKLTHRVSQLLLLGAVLHLSFVSSASAQIPKVAKTPGISKYPASAYQKITQEQDQLLALVDRAIELSKVRYLNVEHHTAWQILHGLLALRQNYELQSRGGTVNAIDYISNGARLKGSYWFEKTPHGGRAHPYNGTMYDFEGHVNQSLAIIAMSNLPLDHQFKVANGQTVTMQDMVNHAKMNVSSKEEITWTLWFLTHYLDQDAEWVNTEGEPWSIEKLVGLQNESSVYNTPCGGTHGLFALAYARNAYLAKHGQLRGEWLRGDQKLQQFISAAQRMQNRDGTFSTKFFKAYGHSYEFDERLKSTGHMTEWLMMALPKKRLQERWIRTAVQSIATDLIRNATKPAECGGLYHAVHALVLYRQRMAPETLKQTPSTDLASQPQPKSGPIVSNKPDDSAYPKSAAESITKSQAKPAMIKAPAKLAQPPSPAKPIQVAEIPAEQREKPSAKPETLKTIPQGGLTAPTLTPAPYEPELDSTGDQKLKPLSDADTSSTQWKKTTVAKTKMTAEATQTEKATPALEEIPEGLMPFLKPIVIDDLEEETEDVSSEEKPQDQSADSEETVTRVSATDSAEESSETEDAEEVSNSESDSE